MIDRVGSRRDHQRFCDIEAWTEVRNARGKPTQHHITYELRLGDGRILRTRISRPANANTYGRGLWSHVLDDQLQVTAAEFWECVDHKRPPQRQPSMNPPATTLPASLAYQLVHALHMTSEEITGMTLERAGRLMAEHWERQAR